VFRDQIERFRIVFRDLAGTSHPYYVCTLRGEQKALVIAATFHDRPVADTNRVYEVADLARVDGDARTFRPRGSRRMVIRRNCDARTRAHAALRSVTVALVVVLLTGCRGEGHVRSQLATADRARLLADARDVHARYSGRTRFARDVPRHAWPASFAMFRPERVWVDDFGVYLCTYEFFVEHAGLYVRTDSSYAPPRSGDPGFEPLGSEFFWYYAPG
jgi:hypothetical protein